MKEYALKIRPNNEMEAVEYNGLKSLQEAIGGYIEHFLSLKICNLRLMFYCDEEFMLKEPTEKNFNVLASALAGNPIFGNVVIDKYIGGGECQGLTEDEIEKVKLYFKKFINN